MVHTIQFQSNQCLWNCRSG